MQSQSDSTNTLIIESDIWQVALQPDMGLQTLFCKASHHGQWLDIMPDCSAEDATLAASNFHMLPYSNRIRDGLFSHAGIEHQLDEADAHSIHGALRKKAWQVLEASNQKVTVAYDTRVDGAVNWPWPMRAEISYRLDANRLVSTISLTNLAQKSMPAGMGWHPYFSRTINDASPHIQLVVAGMYPDTDGDCLPTGKPIALPNDLDFSKNSALDSHQRIDHCFSGFQTPASISWPNAGITLKIHASKNCSHAVLFNPDQAYFAFEPVTNANDGFNLTNQGIDAGVTVLEPGDTLNAEMTLEIVFEN